MAPLPGKTKRRPRICVFEPRTTLDESALTFSTAPSGWTLLPGPSLNGGGAGAWLRSLAAIRDLICWSRPICAAFQVQRREGTVSQSRASRTFLSSAGFTCVNHFSCVTVAGNKNKEQHHARYVLQPLALPDKRSARPSAAANSLADSAPAVGRTLACLG